MKVVIQATAPTVYQLGSLRRFGLPVKQNGNGSYTVNQSYETLKEAKDFLKSRAEQYFDSEKELKKAKSDINKYSMLELDAVRASIVRE